MIIMMGRCGRGAREGGGGGGNSAPVNTVAPATDKNSYDMMSEMYATVTTGTWTGLPVPTFTYQWEITYGTEWSTAGGEGANTNTYNFGGDIFAYIRCKVTATNSEGSAFAYSNTAFIDKQKK